MINADTQPCIMKQTLTIALYMISSIATVFINRNLLKDSTEKVGGLFITWYQIIVELAFIILSSTVLQNVPILNIFPRFKFQLNHLRFMIFPGILMALSIGMSNRCLEFSSVTSYQISRSLTIVFNIIFSYCFLHIRTSIKAILACIGVIIGFIIGIDSDNSGCLASLLLGIGSSITLALYSTMLRRAIDQVNNQFEVLEYTIPISCLTLSIMVGAFGEFAPLYEKHTLKFWINQTIGGIAGIFINIASIICITYTSPLAHNLAGTASSTITATIGYLVYKENFSNKKLVGSFMVIAFSALYSLIKRSEKTVNHDESDFLISADPDYKIDLANIDGLSSEEEAYSESINNQVQNTDPESEPSSALLEP